MAKRYLKWEDRPIYKKNKNIKMLILLIKTIKCELGSYFQGINSPSKDELYDFTLNASSCVNHWFVIHSLTEHNHVTQYLSQ